jgi:hypothetical protein
MFLLLALAVLALAVAFIVIAFLLRQVTHVISEMNVNTRSDNDHRVSRIAAKLLSAIADCLDNEQKPRRKILPQPTSERPTLPQNTGH